MAIKAQVYCRKEVNRFDHRGYIYCWYYRVINTSTGKILSSDNTADWRKMFDSAFLDAAAMRHCQKLGVLKKSRGW